MVLNMFNILLIRWSETRHQKKSDLFCWFSSKTSCHFTSGTLSASWAFILDSFQSCFPSDLTAEMWNHLQTPPVTKVFLFLDIYILSSLATLALLTETFYTKVQNDFQEGPDLAFLLHYLFVSSFFGKLFYAIKSEAVKANTEGIVVCVCVCVWGEIIVVVRLSLWISVTSSAAWSRACGC